MSTTTVDGSFTADAHLVSRVSDTFTADAIVMRVESSSFTADAWLVGLTSGLPFEVDDEVDVTIDILTTVNLYVLDTEFSAGSSIDILTSIEESLTIEVSVGRV